MTYRYLEEIATADIAFEARAASREELFIAAADALVNVMVEKLDDVQPLERRSIEVVDTTLEMLLFNVLQELVFYKDAEHLLLRLTTATIDQQDGEYLFRGLAMGEMIDRSRHQLGADVKAVTMHRFAVEQSDGGWRATAVLDI
jgi:SHS2 domain-containing protein